MTKHFASLSDVSRILVLGAAGPELAAQLVESSARNISVVEHDPVALRRLRNRLPASDGRFAIHQAALSKTDEAINCPVHKLAHLGRMESDAALHNIYPGLAVPRSVSVAGRTLDALAAGTEGSDWALVVDQFGVGETLAQAIAALERRRLPAVVILRKAHDPRLQTGVGMVESALRTAGYLESSPISSDDNPGYFWGEWRAAPALLEAQEIISAQNTLIERLKADVATFMAAARSRTVQIGRLDRELLEQQVVVRTLKEQLSELRSALSSRRGVGSKK